MPETGVVRRAGLNNRGENKYYTVTNTALPIKLLTCSFLVIQKKKEFYTVSYSVRVLRLWDFILLLLKCYQAVN